MYTHFFQKFRCLTILGFFLNIACRNSVQTTESAHIKTLSPEELIEILEPRYGGKYKEGVPITIEVKFIKTVDSVLVSSDEGITLGTIKPSNTKLLWQTQSTNLGSRTLKFKVYNGNINGEREIKFMIVDKNTPVNLSYKIIRSYPHATNAYTQGLVYDNGILYESDGQYGMSSLRKVQIETGKTLKQIMLSSAYFAEGIALLENKIYQITWRENTCFVYDKETFTLLNQFTYDIREGWGLASDGKQLYMSDGSNRIYIIDPANFTVTDVFEVMDNKGPIDNLNELEFVEGFLFANIYQSDYVAVIDLETKRLVGKVNFSGLLKPSDIQANTDVLNGIAYNPHTKRFYITGKNWPKLFEIEINFKR
ncbi:MAG: glutaminyl-peptide cyclotransferase [Bacteroidales bacterium]|nr:glutaminyl-peptide cyclotransferase [Bacteroidales bacterium]